MKSNYRDKLPMMNGRLFLTDGGIETSLIFHDRLELPHFAAFVLLKNDNGRSALARYFQRYIDLATRQQVGFVLESPTWRASPDWAEKLGYSKQDLADANLDAITLMSELRDANETAASPMVISGCVGPRGDGYDPGEAMSDYDAEVYHSEQIGTFARSAADMVTAITMTNTPEAIGLARAAKAHGMPSVISFTVETDGNLPTGQPLAEAITEVDRATDYAPAYFMINCAHPTHFEATVNGSGAWLERIGGLRTNASALSHAELDEATELDDGDPVDLGRRHAALHQNLRNLKVLGGCCGTDHRHVEQICLHLQSMAQAA